MIQNDIKKKSKSPIRVLTSLDGDDFLTTMPVVHKLLSHPLFIL